MSRRVTRSSARGKANIPPQLCDDSSDHDSDDATFTPFDDSMALVASLSLALLKRKRKTPRRKKATPKRRGRRGRWVIPEGFPYMLSYNCDNHPDVNGLPRAATSAGTSTSAEVNLLSDEEDVTIKESQVKGLQNKVNNFFKVIESSDEEMEMLSKTINPVPAPVKPKDFYVIASDSDNEDSVPLSTLKNLDESVVLVADSARRGSTSGIDLTRTDSVKSIAGTIKPNSQVGTSKPSSDKKEDLFAVVDDIIDNYGDRAYAQKDTPPRSLEELQKKTNEILGSVSSFIEDFNKKSTKPEVEKVPESPKKQAPSCPICLDELGQARKPWVTFCGHMFCEQCIKAVCKTAKKCPTCRKKVLLKEVHPVYL